MNRSSRIRRLSYSEVRGNAKGSSFWTNRVSVPLASVMVVGFLRIGILPDTVTVMSALAGFSGALIALVTDGSLAGGFVFLILSQLGYSLDGADGILARAQGTSRKFGEWFDLTLDRMVHVGVLGILMLIDMPPSDSPTEMLAHAGPWMLLLILSLGYHNGSNLRTVLFPRGDSGRERTLVYDRRNLRWAAKGLITGACDYGFFMFVLAVGMMAGLLIWAVWLMIFLHGIALFALGVRVRQLSDAAAISRESSA